MKHRPVLLEKRVCHKIYLQVYVYIYIYNDLLIFISIFLGNTYLFWQCRYERTVSVWIIDQWLCNTCIKEWRMNESFIMHYTTRRINPLSYIMDKNVFILWAFKCRNIKTVTNFYLNRCVEVLSRSHNKLECHFQVINKSWKLSGLLNKRREKLYFWSHVAFLLDQEEPKYIYKYVSVGVACICTILYYSIYVFAK